MVDKFLCLNAVFLVICHFEQTNGFVVLLNNISDRFQSTVDIPSSVLNTHGHLSLVLFEWPPLMLPLPLA